MSAVILFSATECGPSGDTYAFYKKVTGSYGTISEHLAVYGEFTIK